MKWPKLNGIIFGVNLGLLIAVCYFFYTRTPIPSLHATEAAAVDIVPPTPATPVAQVAPKPIVVTNQVSWHQLESEDYKEYIARLKSIGCPDQTIRDIIIADLDKLYAPRVQALQGRRQEPKYWNSEEEELANDVNHRAQEQQERELDREKRRVIEELLGVDLVRERLKQRGQEDYYERRLAFLPEAKRDTVRRILEQYDDQEQAIRGKEFEDGQPITPADKAQLARIQQERQASLATALAPTEVEQMDLWMSPSANAVRHDMYGMNASEEEFQSIYQLRKTFDQKWARSDSELVDESWQAHYEQAKAELNAQIKDQLGEQRFAAYQRGADEDFHRLTSTVSRYNLPRQSAEQVYELKRTLESLDNQVRTNASLTPEQKETALKVMRAETEKEVKGLLGETAYQYYLWKGHASWLVK